MESVSQWWDSHAKDVQGKVNVQWEAGRKEQ